MNIEKMKEVFSDEAFVKSLFELETVAEVQAALQEKGIELTEEEILGVRDFLIKVEEGGISAEQLEKWSAQIESGELSEEMLEQVSGGILVSSFIAGAALTVGVMLASAGAVVGTVFGVLSAIKNRW